MQKYGKDGIKDCFLKAAGSDFLQGKVTDFRATFDWILKPTNFIKIIENNYANGKQKQFTQLATGDDHSKPI
jgi:hypothetical protein